MNTVARSLRTPSRAPADTHTTRHTHTHTHTHTHSFLLAERCPQPGGRHKTRATRQHCSAKPRTLRGNIHTHTGGHAQIPGSCTRRRGRMRCCHRPHGQATRASLRHRAARLGQQQGGRRARGACSADASGAQSRRGAWTHLVVIAVGEVSHADSGPVGLSPAPGPPTRAAPAAAAAAGCSRQRSRTPLRAVPPPACPPPAGVELAREPSALPCRQRLVLARREARC